MLFLAIFGISNILAIFVNEQTWAFPFIHRHKLPLEYCKIAAFQTTEQCTYSRTAK